MVSVYIFISSYLQNLVMFQDMRYDAAIELLRKQVAVQSTCRLHQMLADFFSHVRDEEKAAHHFGIALKLVILHWKNYLYIMHDYPS